jgi:hypothetical protein
MARRVVSAVVGTLALALTASIWLRAQTTVQPIPPGFDFPADEKVLLKLRDGNDVAGMRRHAWMVFAGLTAPTPTGEAVWETWHSAEETFEPTPPPPPGAVRRPQRNFRRPRQFAQVGPAPPPAVGDSLASFTLFNAELRNFVLKHQLQTKTALGKINDSFPPQTPIADRKIPDFPREAVALKTVWWIVKRQGFTAMPIWDAELNPVLPTGNPPRTWKRCVAVDATRATIPPDETTTMPCNGQPGKGTRVVALERFYHFPLTQAQIDAMRKTAVDIPNLSTATPGDFGALVAMHYTTKEIPDWVWATFWWHDQPDSNPFGAHRPVEVKEVWRNYVMAEAYSMDTPKEQDGSARAAYNPWLEARFVNGTVSNCMTCHRRAVFAGQATDDDFLPVTRGTPPANDPRFKGATAVDFLWSIVIESR